MVINNTDDHMRNHGFLSDRNGWKLAPVFDVNPNPDRGAERMSGIGGATAPDDAFDALMDAAERFGLSPQAAANAWDQVRSAVSRWHQTAVANGIPDAEIRRFEPALTRHLDA